MPSYRPHWKVALPSIALVAAVATLYRPAESQAGITNEAMHFEFVGSNCKPKDSNGTYSTGYGVFYNNGTTDLVVSCPVNIPMLFRITGFHVRIYDNARTPFKICYLDTLEHDGNFDTIESSYVSGNVTFPSSSNLAAVSFSLSSVPKRGARVLTCTLAPGASMRTYGLSGIHDPVY